MTELDIQLVEDRTLTFEKACEDFKIANNRMPTLEEEASLWEIIFNDSHQAESD